MRFLPLDPLVDLMVTRSVRALARNFASLTYVSGCDVTFGYAEPY